MYGKTVQGVIRSTFVVDEKGKIEVAQYNVKATGHVAKLRRDLAVASAPRASSSSASEVAARSSTPRSRLSSMLCACVAGSSTPVTRILASGKARRELGDERYRPADAHVDRVGPPRLPKRGPRGVVDGSGRVDGVGLADVARA